MINKVIIGLVLIVLSISCRNEKRENKEFISNAIGKVPYFESLKIKYPLDLNKDFNTLNKKYKIIFYVDTINCLDCDMNMSEWKIKSKELRARVDSSLYEVLFISSPEALNTTIDYFKQMNMENPLFEDQQNQFLKKNDFLALKQIKNRVLLTKNDSIVVIGNPISNKALWQIYLENIK